MRKAIAQTLLDTKAVFLSPDKPFTWASGIQSPIYCDNRKVLAFPKARDVIKQYFLKVLESYDYDAIMGTATAGIPMASILADATHKPLGYVRSGKKAHGRGNQIEGFLEKGAKVIVIEDLLSTGGSVLQVVDALREAGMEVIEVLAIFSYNMQRATDAFLEKQVSFKTLSDFDVLMEVAAEKGLITATQVQQLKAFQQNPADNSWMN